MPYCAKRRSGIQRVSDIVFCAKPVKSSQNEANKLKKGKLLYDVQKIKVNEKKNTSSKKSVGYTVNVNLIDILGDVG